MFRALASRVPKPIFSVKSESPLANIGCSRKISSDSEDHKSEPLENVDTLKCINKVTLMGRVTGTPSPFTVGDTEAISFTLATNELRRNRSNELIKRTEFHRVQVFIPRLANKVKQTVTKGSRVLLDGRINYNVRQGESGTTSFTNIVSDNVVVLTGKRTARNEIDEIDVEDEIKQ